MTMLIGQDIGKKLTDALGLPKNIISFELRVAVDEIVTIKCTYYPENINIDEVEKQFAEFQLSLKESPEANAKE